MTVAPFLDKRTGCNVMPGFKTNTNDLNQIFSSWFWKFPFRQRKHLGPFQRNVNMRLDTITCAQAKFHLEYLLFSTFFQDFSGTFLCLYSPYISTLVQSSCTYLDYWRSASAQEKVSKSCHWGAFPALRALLSHLGTTLPMGHLCRS